MSDNDSKYKILKEMRTSDILENDNISEVEHK